MKKSQTIKPLTLAEIEYAFAGAAVQGAPEYRIQRGRAPDNYVLELREQAVDNSGRHLPHKVWVRCGSYRSLQQMRADSTFRDALESAMGKMEPAKVVVHGQLNPGERCPFTADRIYIGDPCYVVPDALWPEFCRAIAPYDERGRSCLLHATVDGHELMFMPTTHGDGKYLAHLGGQSFMFGVDSGMFAVIPWTSVVAWGREQDALRLGIDLQRPRVVHSGMVLDMDVGELRVGLRLHIKT